MPMTFLPPFSYFFLIAFPLVSFYNFSFRTREPDGSFYPPLAIFLSRNLLERFSYLLRNRVQLLFHGDRSMLLQKRRPHVATLDKSASRVPKMSHGARFYGRLKRVLHIYSIPKSTSFETVVAYQTSGKSRGKATKKK